MAQVQVQQNENQLFLRHFNVPEAVKQNANEAIVQTNILFNLQQTTDTQNVCNVVRRLFLYNIYESKITRNEFNEDMETLKEFNKKMHNAVNQMISEDKVKFTKKFYKLANSYNIIKTRGLYNTFDVNDLFWKQYFNDDALIKQIENIGVKYFFHNKYSSSIRSMIDLPLKTADDYYINRRDYSNCLSNGIYERLVNIKSPIFQMDNYGYVNRTLKYIVDTPNFNNIVVQKFLRYNEALE